MTIQPRARHALHLAIVFPLAAAGCAGSSPTFAPSGTPGTASSQAPSIAPLTTPTPAVSAAPRNPAAYVEGAAYTQKINPADFVGVVDNRYFPLPPGTTYVFEGEGEHVETAVTHDTRVVAGVTTVVVHDQVFKNGALVEDTFDWYAQDRWGNVWYFGEATQTLEGGKVTGTAGSWEAGVDGAVSGVVMLAMPVVGDVYRQEFYAGQAEDLAKVVGLGGSATVAAGAYQPVLVTEDWTPLSPDVVEEKTYAPGVGFIFERFLKGGAGSVELVEIRTGG